MTHPVKLTLYVILILLAAVSGFYASKEWKAVMNRSAPEVSELESIEPESPATPTTNAAVENPEAVTNDTATNVLETAPEGVTNEVGQAGETTNEAVAATAPKKEENLEDVDVSVPTALGNRTGRDRESRIGLWSGVFLLSVVGLAILIGLDVAQFFGTRTHKFLYNEDAEGIANPEYESAEQVWANGNHLEAIRMMREYLQKHPREQFVALRIAEIYEKDLGNYLAAALEYEEVLKHKLPEDRWGWAAIHLCNLYFKLNQEEKAFALLRRLVKEHPGTPAAEKARKRLEQVDAPTMTSEEITEQQVKPPPAHSQPDEPKSNLPPGFRPKK